MRKNLAARMLLVLCFNPAFAGNDDAEMLAITSEQFEYHQKEGVATYQGNVKAVQGSRKLNGDTLEVYRGNAGTIEKIIVYGKPATHESLPDPKKPLFHAQAHTIIYDTTTKILILKNAARVEQGGDIYQAPLIEYDTTQKVVRSPETNAGRTTITLKPRE